MQRLALRRGAAGCTALVALLGAQAVALKATYDTPLDASGPHHGEVCAPAAPTAQRNKAFASWPRAAGAGADGNLLRSLRGRTAAATEPPPPPAGERVRSIRVLILGDSLVSGVGSRVSGSPALPRGFAEALAQKLCARVTWRALGRTGACVLLAFVASFALFSQPH